MLKKQRFGEKVESVAEGPREPHPASFFQLVLCHTCLPTKPWELLPGSGRLAAPCPLLRACPSFPLLLTPAQPQSIDFTGH